MFTVDKDFLANLKKCRAVYLAHTIGDCTSLTFHFEESGTMPKGCISLTSDSTPGIKNYKAHTRKLVSVRASMDFYSFDDHENSQATIKSLLRNGDTIGFEFVIANDSQFVDQCGMTVDQCWLKIYRKGKFVASLLFDDSHGKVDNRYCGLTTQR